MNTLVRALIFCLVPSALLELPVCLAGPSASSYFQEIRPTLPSGGAVVGPRPVFRFTLKGRWEGDTQPVVQVSRDQWKTIERSWDRRQSTRGWQLVSGPGEQTGLFQCPEALAEGPWEWRVRIYSRGSLSEAKGSASFKVDATPPAEIEGLRLRRLPDSSVALSWEPVVYDVEGQPETVQHYVIYRYETRGIFPQSPPMRIGQTRSVSFVDSLKATGSLAVLGIERVIKQSRRTNSNDSAGAQEEAASVTVDTEAAPRPALPRPSNEPSAAPRGSPRVNKAALGKDLKYLAERRSLYYKVVAVDSAGNELGVRELASSPSDDEVPSTGAARQSPERTASPQNPQHESP